MAGIIRRAKATDRGLASRDALAQSHALPEKIIAVKGCANHLFDRLGRGGERIAVRMKPSIRSQRIGNLEHRPDTAFERDRIDGCVRQEAR